MKKAIVVGASSGVGRELAKTLAENSYKVGITARREYLLKELAAEKPDAYVVKPFDLLETDIVLTKLDELVDELGGLDLLVISVGLIKLNTDLDYNVEYKINMVNVTAFSMMCNWAFNLFRKQGYGHLAGITSVAGLRGWRNNPAYNASKAFQMNYLEGLKNLAHYLKLPITVTNIIPGYMETDMKGKTLVFWVCPPEKAARIIFKALCKRQKIIYVYRRWRFTAFLYKHLPNKVIECA